MKKFTLLILTVLILTLTACGGNASNSTEPASVPQSGASASALPASTQLVLGTLKLAETDNAITAEQAAELLPLWQTLVVLYDSDTAAEQEIEALIKQIQEMMTMEQTQAITTMNLTREDMFAVMQEQGLAMGGSSQNSDAQSARPSVNSGGGGFGPGGGAPPAGAIPGGGVGFGGQGQELSPDQIATAQASRQEGSGNIIPTVLINALINFLKEKAGS